MNWHVNWHVNKRNVEQVVKEFTYFLVWYLADRIGTIVHAYAVRAGIGTRVHAYAVRAKPKTGYKSMVEF